jgi:hypothetical protein
MGGKRTKLRSSILFTPVSCLKGHDIYFGKGLLVKDVESASMPKRIDPGVGINGVVLRKQLSRSTNLIWADLKNGIDILCAPPTPIIRTRNRATYIIGDAEAIKRLKEREQGLYYLPEIGLHFFVLP